MIPANKKVKFTELPDGLTNQLEKTLGNAEAPQENKSEEVPVKTKDDSLPPKINEEAVKESQIAKENENEEASIKTVTKTSEKKKNDRAGQINICVPPETKTEWKILFAKNNVNITQGIIFAVEHLKNEIEKNEAVLTVGGVISKK